MRATGGWEGCRGHGGAGHLGVRRVAAAAAGRGRADAAGLAKAAGVSPRSVSDLERGIHRTARHDTAVRLAGALGLAEQARSVFVAAALGRIQAAQVLAARRGQAPGAPLAPADDQGTVSCPR